MKPVSTVGILGGGQLARMLALAGYPLGLRFRLFDPEPTSCGGQVAPLLAGRYEDEECVDLFIRGMDVVTYEFENVPVETARAINGRVPVFPPPRILELTQDRLFEKNFFRGLGIPVPPFRAVETIEELRGAVEQICLPAVLKTRRHGYDGKGQAVLRELADIAPAFARLGGRPLILEQWVPFERELSIIGVRGRGGEIAFYPLGENEHRGGILHRTLAPAPDLTPALQSEAEGLARRILDEVDYVGTFALECFQVGGRLWANEMACRVHNSGHWTIEGAETSQFENHLRAVCGLPLGSTAPRGASAMFNLIGEIPEAAKVLARAGAHLHLYGKEPKPGRKLGHITLRADDAASLAEMMRKTTDTRG